MLSFRGKVLVSGVFLGLAFWFFVLRWWLS